MTYHSALITHKPSLKHEFIESLLQNNRWGTEELHKPALSINEAAELLGVSKSTMKGLIYMKRVGSVRIGRRVLVVRSSLMDVLASGSV